jgi:hypothetical protein
LSLRCTAARALGSLNYTDATGIDALATARDLAALAAFACRQEDERVREEFEKLDKTAPFATARGGMPGMGGTMPGMMPGAGGTMPGMMPGAGGTMPGMMPGAGGMMPGMMPGAGGTGCRE